MKQVEIFYDYICPYCLSAQDALEAVWLKFNGSTEIIWTPCESHPRPDPHRPHSDLLIAGLFFAAEKGADLWEYHRRAYCATLAERLDVEQIEVVVQVFAGLLDEQQLAAALRDGRYRARVEQNNERAFMQSGVWAVPAYRMDGKKLDAVEGVGVTTAQLEQFLQGG